MGAIAARILVQQVPANTATANLRSARRHLMNCMRCPLQIIEKASIYVA